MLQITRQTTFNLQLTSCNLNVAKLQDGSPDRRVGVARDGSRHELAHLTRVTENTQPCRASSARRDLAQQATANQTIFYAVASYSFYKQIYMPIYGNIECVLDAGTSETNLS